MIRIAITAAVLSAALATTGSSAQSTSEARQDARLVKALAGLAPGEALHCIDRDRVTEIETFKNTIVYEQGRNKKWRNDTVGSCPGLARGDIVVSHSLQGVYCAGDMIETRSRTGGMMTGACSLGEFVPYSK